MEQPDSGKEENRYKDKTTSGLDTQYSMALFSTASSFIKTPISLMKQKFNMGASV